MVCYNKTMTETKVDPESVAIVAVIGAIGTAATYTLFRVADIIGPELKMRDLLPALPPNPPLPQFLIKKPEVAESVKSMFGLE